MREFLHKEKEKSKLVVNKLDNGADNGIRRRDFTAFAKP